MRSIIGLFVAALLWACIGQLDIVAVAPGKTVVGSRTKVIQTAETAVVRRILVQDGQAVKQGQVRLIAALIPNRDPALPDVPTAREQGVDVSLEAWRGIAVPHGTPRPAIAALESSIRRTVESTEFQKGAENLGVVWAISAENGQTVFKHEQRVGLMSLAATAGGLVFGGDVAGNFRALDDTTGEVLWETNIGAPVSGYPVSFAVDGKQYIAVTTGQSLVGSASRRVTPELTGESPPAQVVVFALP